MHFSSQISSLLIGFSFSFLIWNQIAFGFALVIGILLLFVNERKNLLTALSIQKKVYIFSLIPISTFLVPTILSIKPDRSIIVVLYLFTFFYLSLNLFNCLKKNQALTNKIIKYLILSAQINILVVFSYVISEFNFSDFFHFNIINAAERYKGFLNIFTILALIPLFFKKSKKNIIIFFILIPTLIISNCNSAILGIVSGIFGCLIFFLYDKVFFKKNIFIIIILAIGFFTTNQIIKNLPKKFDLSSVQNFEHTIPKLIIDKHRQFMWGFSLSKFLDKPFFGFGPDTSNYIPGSQKEIGAKSTGNMRFISSHPHNFLIELLLDTGLIGAISFIFSILLINLLIARKSYRNDLYLLIFFNFYFWGSSLVNFSFWSGWWQGSYFFILSIIASKIHFKKIHEL